MLRRRTLLLFLLALLLRLLLQGWDAGVTSSSSHPDERQVGFVTEKAEGWFADPGFYAYGSLHFQAVRATAAVLGQGNQGRGIIVSGRVISLIASMLAIALGWMLAYHAWGRRTGDLFILLAAWIPLDLQQSHFTTVEAHHAGWVMAALAACFWLARSNRPIAAAATGAAIGASLAVKIASVALGLPLVVAVLIAVRGRGAFAALRLLAIAGATGIMGFWLCQPWAFAHARPPLSIVVTALAAVALIELANRRIGRARSALLVTAVLIAVVSFLQMAALVGIGGETFVSKLGSVVLAGTALNPAYLEGVGREVAMVVGATDVAYVRIYAHTLPVLYPLRELALWGWGVLLVLAVAAGGAAGSWRLTKRWRRWVAGRFNDSSILLAILLAWLIPMTLRLSTLQVKFMRYWEPLVVPAALIASWWLMRLPRRFRRRAVISVVAGTLLWGLAYSWAFIEPHPHRTASEWFSPMLADGQVVAFEHWDEHIALNLENAVVDRAELPSYELPESEGKLALWTGALARSDWVVLTSNRVYRTVLANSDRFEETARLYRLLLSGEAGFEVMTRVRRGPRIFGLRWPVQRADESFINYEFPQVVILRRVAEIDPEDLIKRVSRPLPFLEHMGSIDLERGISVQDTGRSTVTLKGSAGSRFDDMDRRLRRPRIRLLGTPAADTSGLAGRRRRTRTVDRLDRAGVADVDGLGARPLESQPSHSDMGVSHPVGSRCFHRHLALVSDYDDSSPASNRHHHGARCRCGDRRLVPHGPRLEPGHLLGRETNGFLVPQCFSWRSTVAPRRALDGRHATPLLLLRRGSLGLSDPGGRLQRRRRL